MVDFAAVADAEDDHDEAIVLDGTDEPVIADAVFPELL
jgi:hypothetical protein